MANKSRAAAKVSVAADEKLEELLFTLDDTLAAALLFILDAILDAAREEELLLRLELAATLATELLRKLDALLESGKALDLLLDILE